MIYKKNSIQVQVTEAEFREYLAGHPEFIRDVNRQYDPILVIWKKPDSEYAIASCQVDTHTTPATSSNFILDSDEWLQTDEAKHAAERNAASVAGQIEAGGVEPFN